MCYFFLIHLLLLESLFSELLVLLLKYINFVFLLKYINFVLLHQLCMSGEGGMGVRTGRGVWGGVRGGCDRLVTEKGAHSPVSVMETLQRQFGTVQLSQSYQ